MNQQLTLLDVAPDWRLDEQTKEIGRRGLARARAALQGRSPVTAAETSSSDDIPRAA